MHARVENTMTEKTDWAEWANRPAPADVPHAFVRTTMYDIDVCQVGAGTPRQCRRPAADPMHVADPS